MHAPGKQRIVTWGLLETVIITALVLFLSWKFQKWTYVAIWSLLGWTQMLRTRQSTGLGLRMFVPVGNRLTSWLLGMMDWFGALKYFGHYKPSLSTIIARAEADSEESTPEPQLKPRDFLWPQTYLMLVAGYAVMMILAVSLLVWIILLAAVLVAWAAVVRLVATFWTCLCHPGASIRAIPRNWRRIAWAWEMTAPLELVARHRLFLRMREHGGEQTTSHEMLTSFDLSNWRMELSSWRRMLASMGLAVGLTVTGIYLHNPKPDKQVGEWNLDAFVLQDRLRVIQLRLAERRAAEASGIPQPSESSQAESPKIDWSLAPTTTQLEQGREQVRRALEVPLKKLAVEDFDFFDWKDWLQRVRWYSNWPQRTLGTESLLAGVLRAFLFVIWSALALLLAAYYFGLWAFALLLALSTPLRLLLFVPTLLYRLSLKASALTYAPLFFVVEGPVVAVNNPKRTCEYQQLALLPGLQRGWALVTLLFLIIKFLAKTLMPTGQAVLATTQAMLATNQVVQLTNQVVLATNQVMQVTNQAVLAANQVVQATMAWLEKLPLQISPRFIYPWEIASAVVILLTFMIHGVTKQTLWKHRDDPDYSFDAVSRVVRGSERLRSILSIYSVVCLMLILSSTHFREVLALIEWPTVHWLFLPPNHPLSPSP